MYLKGLAHITAHGRWDSTSRYLSSDKVARKVSLKEHVIDFPPQPVITKDNVTIEIDTVVYFQITDPKLFAYGVENPMAAIENLTATTLRNIIGELELDGTLTSREHINSKIRLVLDEATDAWGIKINRVEVKNITPPRDIQMAMEKQMRAERERREAILRAEGEKKSAVLIAEGNKEAVILEAEASKQAAIKAAEGEAEAIRMVQQATADGIRMLSDANASKEVLTLKGLEAFEKAADGKRHEDNNPVGDTESCRYSQLSDKHRGQLEGRQDTEVRKD